MDGGQVVADADPAERGQLGRVVREIGGAVAVLALTLGLMIAALIVGRAEGSGAGPDAAGYAQTARAALSGAGKPSGYMVQCRGWVTDWATDQVRVACLMSHPGPWRWRGQETGP